MARQAPGPAYARELLHLQATGGNAMVGRLLRSAAASGPRVEEHDEAARDDIAARIRQRLGRGERLAADVHQRFAPALGESLGEVRVHTDPQAADLAREVGARAFTTGSDVFFGSGAYQPDTAHGAELLAHELTHTVQRPATPSGPGELRVSDPGDREEQEADRTARQLVAGDAVRVAGTGHSEPGAVSVHRATDTTVTTTDKSESSYDPASATWSNSSKTSVVSGDESTGVTRSSKRSAGLAGGDLSYSGTTSTQTEESGPGFTGSSSRTDTRKVGTGGYSSTTSTTDRVGDVSVTNTSGTSYTGTGGKFGRTRTTGHTAGVVDDKGNLVSGTSTTRTTGGGSTGGSPST